MVENCFETAVFCICAVILAVTLRQYSREHSLLLTLAACTGVFVSAMMFIMPIVSETRDIFTQAGISENYISLIFKASAICFITQLTSGICNDSGESSIAAAAEMWGRAAITYISIPVLKAVIERIELLIR